MHYKAEPSVRDIMMSSPISLQRDNKLSPVEYVMASGRIRHVPILDGEHLVGVLSQADLFHSAFAKAMHLRPREQRDLVDSIKIEDVMSKHVISVPVDTSIRAAALDDGKEAWLPARSSGRTASRACHQERYVTLSRGAERRRSRDRG